MVHLKLARSSWSIPHMVGSPVGTEKLQLHGNMSIVLLLSKGIMGSSVTGGVPPVVERVCVVDVDDVVELVSPGVVITSSMLVASVAAVVVVVVVGVVVVVVVVTGSVVVVRDVDMVVVVVVVVVSGIVVLNRVVVISGVTVVVVPSGVVVVRLSLNGVVVSGGGRVMMGVVGVVVAKTCNCRLTENKEIQQIRSWFHAAIRLALSSKNK